MINLMTNRPRTATLFTLSAFLFCTALWENSAVLAQVVLSHPAVVAETPPELADDFEVLTRGALHEAFASPHQSNPESSPIIAAAPPELIDEVPPEYKPEGGNVQWIPGYWAWGEAQNDYIWISGVWRDAPPERNWVPGYWDQTNAGYRWVSGYWAEEIQQEVGYLPQPPTSIDQGPSTVAPSEQHFYIPGNWQFQNDHYRWAAGYWSPMVENWIWVPANYVWTPRGCIYQSGYWDYEFDQRGTCFAPVHFNRPVYHATNYQYQPSFALNLSIDFLTHLFVRPHSSQYYYGDYYSTNFTNLGFQPWVSYRSHYGNYDPLLAYYGHRRSTINNRYNTVQYLAQQHRFYASNQTYRPRPTFAAQFNFNNSFQNQSNHRYHDYVKKSNYVRTYSNHRNSSQRKLQAGNVRGGQQHRSNYHRMQEVESRSNRQKIDQLAKLQRDRKQREVRLASNESQRRSTNYRPDRGQRNDVFRNSAEVTRRQTADQDRRARDRDRERANQITQSLQRADRQRRDEQQRRSSDLSRQRERQQRSAEQARDTQRRTADAASRDRQRRASDLARQREREQRSAERDRDAQRRTANAASRDRQRRVEQQRQTSDLARQREREKRSAEQARDAQRRTADAASRDRQRQASDRARQREREQRSAERDRDAQRRTADAANRDRQRRVEQQRQTSDLARQRERQQRSAEQAREQSRRTQAARNQPSQRDRSQQDVNRGIQEAQRDAARRTAQKKSKQDAARRTQEAKRNADRQRQQRSKRDAARREQAKSKQDSARRAQQAKRDSARRAQDAKQKAQKDAARRSQQKARTKSSASKKKSKSKSKKK